MNPVEQQQNIQEAEVPGRRRHWQGLPAVQPVEGSLTEVLRQLPHFGRQPFTMTSVNGTDIAVNPYLDMVYRAPTRQGESPVPVGVVSKNYRLIDHHQILLTIEDVLADFGIDSSRLRVRGEWTLHGERARFSLIFPSDERFTIKLGDEDEMRFRIEIFNSVDGSCRLMVVAGWLRFVCSNGLILGTALMQLRQQHRQQLQIEGMGRLLREALKSAGSDKDVVADWQTRTITTDTLTEWVDTDVHAKWGIKASVRLLSVLMTGRDAEPKGDLRSKRPSEVAILTTNPVPGIERPVADAFLVSQALTWVAGQRAEIEEDLEWRSHVPELMELLINKAVG